MAKFFHSSTFQTVGITPKEKSRHSLEIALHLHFIAANMRSSSCIQSSNKASPTLDNVMICRDVSDSLNKQV